MAYNRWNNTLDHSVPFRLFKEYHEELNAYIWANYAGAKYVYNWLAKHGATWGDAARKHLTFPKYIWNFDTLKDWSDSYNKTQNWINLNAVVAMSANLETYLASIIKLAIESDPGVLINASHKVDGTILLKENRHQFDVYAEHAEKCTKGTWSTRFKELELLFGPLPSTVISHTSMLDSIRRMRNNVGHAFGRDIDDARNIRSMQILSPDIVSMQRLKNWLGCVYEVATEIDSFLMSNNVGEYQLILYYHEMYPLLSHYLSAKEKAQVFKTEFNKKNKGNKITKSKCVDLAEYYDSIRHT